MVAVPFYNHGKNNVPRKCYFPFLNVLNKIIEIAVNGYKQ